MITAPEYVGPQAGPQEDYFDCDADICIYGGSAGGGKTFALMVEPLQYLIEDPGFGGVIFRRTFPQVTAQGGLWDEACEIYPDLGGKPRYGSLSFKFEPYGNTLAFRHLQHEETKHDWQGSQLCFIGFDELPHFSASQFWYLSSRNRSRCGVKPYIRATCNPDPGWVKGLLAPWVDKAFAGERAESGELRWFVRRDGEIAWVDEGTPDARSLTFIRATVFDNEILLRKNPEYLATLMALPAVERARLLDGDWDVRREGLVYPGFDACLVDEAPRWLEGPNVGGIDFGWHNPFVAVWGREDHDGVLWITGMRHQSYATIPVHARAIPTGVRYWCDPANPEGIEQLGRCGHLALPCVHRPVRLATGEMRKPILSGIDRVAERIRTGRLKIVRPACLPLVREFGLYCYDEGRHSEGPRDEDNHGMDGVRYLIVGLDRNRTPPEVRERDAALRAARESQAVLDRAREAEIVRADPDDERWWPDEG